MRRPASRLADPGVQLIDADGDGRTDLLVTTGGAVRLLSPPASAACGIAARSSAMRRPPASTSKIRRCSWWTWTATASPTPSAPAAPRVLLQRPAARAGTGHPLGRAPGAGGLPQRQLLRPARQVGRHDRRRPAGHRAGLRRQRRVLAEPGPRQLGQARFTCATARASPTATIPKRILVGDVDGDGAGRLCLRRPHARSRSGSTRAATAGAIPS